MAGKRERELRIREENKNETTRVLLECESKYFVHFRLGKMIGKGKLRSVRWHILQKVI